MAPSLFMRQPIRPIPRAALFALYVFTGYRQATSRNCKPALMDALHAGAE